MARSEDDPGGEYISVLVRVNGHVEFMRDAVLSEVRPNGHRVYKIDDTDSFQAPKKVGNKKDYFIELAKRLLKVKGNR